MGEAIGAVIGLAVGVSSMISPLLFRLERRVRGIGASPLHLGGRSVREGGRSGCRRRLCLAAGGEQRAGSQ